MRSNEFLSQLKETGKSYEEVLEMVKPGSEPQEIELEDEIEEEEEVEEDEGDIEEPEKTGPQIDAREIIKQVSTGVIKTVTPEIRKIIQSELKKLRTAPPKGKKGSEPVGPSPVISKNLFEKIV